MKQKDLNRLLEIKDDIGNKGFELENELICYDELEKAKEIINQTGIELTKISNELNIILFEYYTTKKTNKMIKDYCKETNPIKKQEILNR